jgi:hypothetical protein
MKPLGHNGYINDIGGPGGTVISFSLNGFTNDEF